MIVLLLSLGVGAAIVWPESSPYTSFYREWPTEQATVEKIMRDCPSGSTNHQFFEGPNGRYTTYECGQSTFVAEK